MTTTKCKRCGKAYDAAGPGVPFGSPDGNFCSGACLNEFGAEVVDRERARAEAEAARNVFELLISAMVASEMLVAALSGVLDANLLVAVGPNRAIAIQTPVVRALLANQKAREALEAFAQGGTA